ncbi:uncharacterized protein LOC108249398 [Kryptolebias marmoratus]|uniref:uncharacterized protein LOC108249398 n=1 Tax=Kryptolebias marmoratus TaxID=37003 RepID=UPI0018AC9274|nr:uncharacterized protein LOC108249398 [Kryptolebias marmoratus]
MTVNLAGDTLANLKYKLAKESGIPANFLHYKNNLGSGNTLESCGIKSGSTVYFTLSTFSDEDHTAVDFFNNDVEPSVQQTPKGMSVLFSPLYIIKCRLSVDLQKRLISYIRKLTGYNPLAQSLYQLLCKNEHVSRTQKIAVVEGMYILFRELLPGLGTKQEGKIIEDLDVFEQSTYCWAYLMSEAQKETSEHENYAPYSLKSENGSRFYEPVRVPGVPNVLERADMEQNIKGMMVFC